MPAYVAHVGGVADQQRPRENVGYKELQKEEGHGVNTGILAKVVYNRRQGEDDDVVRRQDCQKGCNDEVSEENLVTTVSCAWWKSQAVRFCRLRISSAVPTVERCRTVKSKNLRDSDHTCDFCHPRSHIRE
jgi:hypothetical protein